jgi:hypothetical protein
MEHELQTWLRLAAVALAAVAMVTVAVWLSSPVNDMVALR